MLSVEDLVEIIEDEVGVEYRRKTNGDVTLIIESCSPHSFLQEVYKRQLQLRIICNGCGDRWEQNDKNYIISDLIYDIPH